jgi:hypothetical protein
MKPGDLIEVRGGTLAVALMHNENFSNAGPVPQGIIGIVLEVADKRAFAAGYVKLLLSGDRVGFIYKDALRIME